jgi:hypothetical protein
MSLIVALHDLSVVPRRHNAIFRFTEKELDADPKSAALCGIPPRAEVRIAIVTDVEAGSGGRDGSQAFDAPDERADLPVSGLRWAGIRSVVSASMAAFADGQAAWSWSPDAGIKLTTTLSRRVGDGGQKARCTEESAE